MKKICGTIQALLIFFFSIIILYLTILAGFSTSMMNNDEHTYLIQDSMVINILGLLLFISFFFGITHYYLLRRHKKSLSPSDQKSRIRRICNILLYAIGIFAFLFVVSTQRNTNYDQFSVQEIVNQWIDKNYSCFNKGGYLDQYPHQAGIIIICYFFSFIFGTKNYLAFRLANVIALTIIYKEFGDIAEKKTGRIAYRLIIYVFGVLFVPGIMYTGFVYGNIISLAFMLASFKYTLLFIEKQKIGNGCIVVITIFCAIVIKHNYLIFGIALAIYLLIELIKKFRGEIIALFAIIVVLLPCTGMITNEFVYNITGIRMSKGESQWSWITMGVMENKKLYDGWYNQYNYDSYAEANFDAEKQAEKNKEDLKTRLQLFKNDPQYAIRFFAGKNASQWNNPGFQNVWLNQVAPKNIILRQPPWVNYLINDDGTSLISQFSNYFHFILLAGVLLHVFQGGIKKNPHEIFYILTFIGGFLFHTIWEAKGQYTLSFFWLLLPLSAEGYVETTESISFLTRKKCIPGKPSTRTIIPIGIVLVSIVLLSMNNSFFRDVFFRNEDTASFSEYISNNKAHTLHEGNYLIHPKQDSSLLLSINPSEEGPSTALMFEKDENKNADIIYIYNSLFEDCQFIEFRNTIYALDVPGNKKEAGTEIWAYSKKNTAAQHWEFKRKEGNEYVIYHNELVLTYSIEDNRIYLDNYNDSEQQKWIVDALEER